MAITDSGWDGLARPASTDWEEHGAQGDRSDGRRFKKVQSVPMSVMIDEASSTVTYFGFAKPGTATSDAYWRVLKMTVSSTVTSFQFANGADTFVSSWDNRASLSYS